MKTKPALSLLAASALLLTPRAAVAGEGGEVAAALVGGFVGGMVAGMHSANAQLGVYPYGPGLPVVPLYPVAPVYPIYPTPVGAAHYGHLQPRGTLEIWEPGRYESNYDEYGRPIQSYVEGHYKTVIDYGPIYLPPPVPVIVSPRHNHSHRPPAPRGKHFQLPSQKGSHHKR